MKGPTHLEGGIWRDKPKETPTRIGDVYIPQLYSTKPPSQLSDTSEI